jgi:hypothetical protein
MAQGDSSWLQKDASCENRHNGFGINLSRQNVSMERTITKV